MKCLTLLVGFSALALAGCSLEPPATALERAQLAKAGKPYAAAFEKRALPDLPSELDWADVLHRAFLANGDLEAAYFEWQAAVARIAPSAVWPNSNVQVGFDYAFSKSGMKGWNATMITAGFDPAMMLTFPVKAQQAGKVSLEGARAAGQRFLAAKFALQQKVLTTWLDYALASEKIRLQNENLRLLSAMVEISQQRVRTGGPQQDLLKAQTELSMARNELAGLENELASLRATLNGMLSQSPEAELPPPARLPSPRPLPVDDVHLMAAAAQNNPELAAMAHGVAERENALELARLAYLPDFSPQFSIEGNAQQMVGMMVNLPTSLVRIRGQIDESQANLRQSQALLRQGRSDRVSLFVATLYAFRNADRQANLLNDDILPRATQLWQASHQAYSAGSIGFAELIDTQRTLLQVRLLLAEARVDREKRLAELETLAGLDAETIATPTRPTSAPVAKIEQALRPQD